MKLCNTCQKENDNDAKFCTACGAEFPEQTVEPLKIAPIAENDTPMNKETLKRLYKRFKSLGIFFLIFGAACLGLYIIERISQSAEDDYFLFAGCVILGCGVAFLWLHNVYVNKNKFITENTHVVYRFYEDNFYTYTFDGDKKKEASDLSYSNISKVRQIGEFIYLYLGANALVLDANFFTVGTKQVLVEHLKKQCGPLNVKIKL